MSSFFSDDPEYNGLHACPKCGAPSQWRAVDFDKRTVAVECSGPCGCYEEPYSRLSDFPYFDRNQAT
jgi:hypothetical protein